MTFLEAVNNVLKRLREEEVLSVSDTKYSKLIGTMINDAKTQVENAYSWNALQTSIDIATVAGTHTYTLTGSGSRLKVLNNVNDQNKVTLAAKPWSELVYLQKQGAVGNTAPYYYAFNGINSSGDSKVTLFPTPDNVYNISFLCIVPQSDLVSDSDVISVPSLPVVLGAYARAVAERGEDQGMNSSEIYGLYKDALSDAIAIENSRTAEEATWDMT
jgi:hypothetical protein